MESCERLEELDILADILAKRGRLENNVKTKRILIVDDDHAGRTFLQAILQNYGYTCEVAENGQQALLKLASSPSHVVITDHHMPIMNGLQFLEELTRRTDLGSPSVIFITAYESMALKARALELGARAVIMKPLPIDELLGAIRTALPRQSSLDS